MWPLKEAENVYVPFWFVFISLFLLSFQCVKKQPCRYIELKAISAQSCEFILFMLFVSNIGMASWNNIELMVAVFVAVFYVTLVRDLNVSWINRLRWCSGSFSPLLLNTVMA